MAAVLPFDPAFRRRTPPAPRRAVAGTAGATGRGPAARRRTPAASHPAVRVRPARAVHAAVDESELARVFFPLVLIVALLDLATKAFAVAGLTGATLSLGGPFALHLVYNSASAGGVWLGEHTRALNFTATGVVVGLLVMLVPTLARVDRRSPVAVALIAGGGLGNLVSLATSARGVPDFLAVRHGHGAWVLNVADVAMGVGFVLLARTVVVIARSIRAHGAGRRVVRGLRVA